MTSNSSSAARRVNNNYNNNEEGAKNIPPPFSPLKNYLSSQMNKMRERFHWETRNMATPTARNKYHFSITNPAKASTSNERRRGHHHHTLLPFFFFQRSEGTFPNYVRTPRRRAGHVIRPHLLSILHLPTVIIPLVNGGGGGKEEDKEKNEKGEVKKKFQHT